MPPDETQEVEQRTVVATWESDGLLWELMVGGTAEQIKATLADVKAEGGGDYIQTVPTLRASLSQPSLVVVGSVAEGDEFPGRPDTPDGDIAFEGGPAQDAEVVE